MYKRHFIGDCSLRLDEFLYQKGISKKILKAIKLQGDILVNGVHQTVRYQVQCDDEITLIYPEEICEIPPVDIPLKVVYEDDYLLVIDKQKDLACIPTRTHYDRTLAHALSYYYHQHDIHSTIHFINRLDKDTQGLMLVAKYREVHDMMTKDIKHIFRKYCAHVSGVIGSGTINLPIYKDGHQMRRIIDSRGKPSCTHYRCLKTMEDMSLVECVLETGRTHQIRVHMSSIGHPLIGDTLYDGKEGPFDLTSMMIAFVHPVTKQIKVITKKL